MLLLLALACRNDKDTVDTGPVDRDQDLDGWVASLDCDDLDAGVNPDQQEQPYNGVDDDCDPETVDDDLDGDGYGRAEDCDDEDPDRSPGATETCDGVDDDCNGLVDDAAGDLWYRDDDQDGYGDPATATEGCAEEGLVADATDCDDGDAAVNPAGTEVCNDVDDDCDGDVDEGVLSTFYVDADGDGRGDPEQPVEACEAGQGTSAHADDCDDGDPAVNPSANEVCNGVDDDCDGTVDGPDAADALTWYADTDGDGYGDESSTQQGCEQPSGYVADDSDCDDTDGAVNPDTVWYADADGDGFGDPSWTFVSCLQLTGTVADATDCDDLDADANPDGTEVCDGVDNDCDGTADNDDEVLGDAEDCAAQDCAALLSARSAAGDGAYYLDPDGNGAFQAWCDMSTDGGGWTLVGSFVNGDGTYNWTQYGSDPDNLGTWTDDDTFGSLSTFTTADFKSEAFSRVDATDLLAVDDAGDWASYDGALSAPLLDTLSAYTSCQTSFLSGVTVDSSVAGVAAYGQLSFFGGDPNNGDRCALNYQADSTDSSVIAMAHQGCGTAGFGHVGWWTGSAHTDADAMFCLQNGNLLVDSAAQSGFCSAYHGQSALYWFDPTPCSYSLLYVR